MGHYKAITSLVVSFVLASGCGGRTEAEWMLDASYGGAALATGGMSQVNRGGASTGGSWSLGGAFATGGNSGRGGSGTGGYVSRGGSGTGGYVSRGGSGTGGYVSRGGSGTGGYVSRGGSGTGGYVSRGGAGTGGYVSRGGAGTGGYVSRGGAGTGGYVSRGGAGTGGYVSRGGANTGGYATGGYVSRGGANTGGAAIGGAGGIATAGAGGTVSSCVPGASVACACADGSSGAQVCQANGTFAECRCLLTELKSKIIGYWVGTRTTTWDGTHKVEIKFTADGHYSPYCPDGCTTMYWGTDKYSNNMTYAITTVNSEGMGSGRIAIVFDASTTNEGSMTSIVFDATGKGLTFTVWKDGYGPLDFVLSRG